MDSTYGHESREMYPSKDYFRTNVVGQDLSKLESGPAKPIIKKLPVNYDNLTRQEAVEVFQGMLSDLGVAVTWKWEDVNRVVQHDERVKVLRTMADRKQAFQDFTIQLKNTEKEELREKKIQARENFIQLLEEQGTQLNYLSRYYEVSKKLQREPRFRAIEERDREDVF